MSDGLIYLHSDYASKVVRGLSAGIAVRNVAWFVFDKGLSENAEAFALEKEQCHRMGVPKWPASVPYLQMMVRKLRATYFRSSLVPVPACALAVTPSMEQKYLLAAD